MNEFSKLIRPIYERSKGMYVGEEYDPTCKENKHVLITYVPTGNKIQSKKTYQRNYKNFKKGDHKLIDETKCLYNNILEAWKEVDTYPTVSYGLTNWQRNVLIVDVDDEFESLDLAIKMLEKSKPTYIIRNPKSGHIQFGWVLSEAYIVTYQNYREDFNREIKELSKVYKSDSCFNGPACKNPYYHEFESVVYEDRIYSQLDAISLATLGFTSDFRSNSNITINNKDYNIIPPLSSFLSYIITNTNLNENTNKKSHVRRYMDLLRSRIFKYFRDNKCKLTDEKIILQFEEEIVNVMIEEGYVFNNINQTKDATKKIVDWCNTKGWANFHCKDGSIVKEIDYTMFGINSRRKSLEVRKEKKGEKVRRFRKWMFENHSIVDLESKGKPTKGKISRREAAKRIGISYDEFRNYLKDVELGVISIVYDEEDESIDRSRSYREISQDSGREIEFRAEIGGEESEDKRVTPIFNRERCEDEEVQSLQKVG